MTATRNIKASHHGIPVSPLQLKMIQFINAKYNTTEWFTLEDAKEFGLSQTAYICRELVSKGIFEKDKKLEFGRLAKAGLSTKKTFRIKYRLVANPPLKKKKQNKMKTHYDSDMIAMFFGANHFKPLGKQTWERDNLKVKIIAGHKFLITNTDTTKKHKHIATVLIPKNDQTMYTLFNDLLGMKLTT